MFFHNFYRIALMGLLLATLVALPIRNTVQASPMAKDQPLDGCGLDDVHRQNLPQNLTSYPAFQQALLQVNDSHVHALGYSIVLSRDGNTTLVSATRTSADGSSSYGTVFVFTRSVATWTVQAELTSNEPGVYLGPRAKMMRD